MTFVQYQAEPIIILVIPAQAEIQKEFKDLIFNFGSMV